MRRGRRLSDKPALYLIGHGTKDSDGAKQFFETLELSKSLRPDIAVGGGFIEFAEPSLDDGLEILLRSNPKHVVAVPLVLLGAGHQKDDGPMLLDRARSKYKNTHFTYARALGLHPSVLDAVLKSIKQIDSFKLSPTQGIALIGRGSTDPDANSDLYKIARLIDERLNGSALVETGFVSLTFPTVTQTLYRLKSLGAKSFVVTPYFLFKGVLLYRIHHEALAWAESNDFEVHVSSEIGPDNLIANLIWERYDEAVSGESLMNCDYCKYRFDLTSLS